MVSKRQSNLELLRIISMLLIIMQHFIEHGGVLGAVEINTMNFYIVRFLETLTLISVNCYVLISGYFLVDSKFKLSKLLNILFEVLIYSITLYIFIILFTENSFSTSSFLMALFPVITGEYWFVTIYILLFCLSPFLNILINHLTEKQFKYHQCV